MNLRKILIAGAFVVASVGSASAADIPMAPVAIAPPPPVDASFSWAGPYVGAYGGGMFGNGLMFGGTVGYAFEFGNWVAAVEGQVGIFVGPGFHLTALGRIGPAIGERLWLYGLGGWSNRGPWEFGGGVAYAINDRMSVHVDVSIYTIFTAISPVMIKGGVNWHLGN